MHQSRYIAFLFQEYNLLDSNPVCLPADPKRPLGNPNGMYSEVPDIHSMYMKLVGELVYLLVNTCPDIAYIVNALAQHGSNTESCDFTAGSTALMATCQFLQMVKMQFEVSVQGWMSDFGGEYKSAAYDDLLKGEGIQIYNSASHIPQQNGHAERFMRTLMDKAEAMRHLACLPDSWWEFATAHATHIYNRTPLSHLQWRTPYEALHSKQP